MTIQKWKKHPIILQGQSPHAKNHLSRVVRWVRAGMTEQTKTPPEGGGGQHLSCWHNWGSLVTLLVFFFGLGFLFAQAGGKERRHCSNELENSAGYEDP